VSRTPLRSVAATTALASGLVVGLWSSPASAASFTCGSTITADALLSTNLDCTGKPITIAGAGITVNLNGHTITSTTPCSHPQADCTVTFDQGSTGARLINGRLQGAGVTALTPKVELSRLRTNGGILWLGGDGDQIVDSITNGTDVVLARSHTVARRNWVTGGRGIQIQNFDHQTNGLVIADNLVTQSTGPGIGLSTNFYGGDGVGGTVTRNALYRNAGPGLSFAGNLQELGAITVSANLFFGNSGDGIFINGSTLAEVPFSGGPVTLTRNITVGDGRRGINAGWIPGRPTGIVDGGGNTASLNAFSPQCVGVAC
jgi:hypothetical protein